MPAFSTRVRTAADELAARLLSGDEPADLLAADTLREAARHAVMTDPYLLAQIAQGWALLGLRDQIERFADAAEEGAAAAFARLADTALDSDPQ